MRTFETTLNFERDSVIKLPYIDASIILSRDKVGLTWRNG